MALGILTAAVIWAKLRLVGDLPRTAYAEPADETPASNKPHAPVRLD